MQELLDAAPSSAYEAAAAKWQIAAAACAPNTSAGASAAQGYESAGTWTEARLKRGDCVSGVTGTQLITLAGDLRVQFTGSAVVDATDGTELPTLSALSTRHRCLVAENTAASFEVSSRTAVVSLCGPYRITPSGGEPDYNAIAGALRMLNLFRGTDTAFGEGYDLEKAPTRLQALVMLIRMLGEEDAALRCASPSPFRDVPDTHWGSRYVAYAFEKGYTNGVDSSRFAPDSTASAAMYVEFILRALGYSSTAQSDISTAVERAYSFGVITAGERASLAANEFLRADVAYLSWYALSVPLPGTLQTLREKLEFAGAFTEADYRAAAASVTSSRL